MEDFVRVGEPGEVPPGRLKLVDVAGQRVALANVDGQICAFSDECTHDGGPLSEGDLEGEIVTCPWHFSRFNVRTGEVVESPADEVVEIFEVDVRPDGIYVGGRKTAGAHPEAS